MMHKWWEIPGISLLMLALSAVSTYPLILHFDIGIISPYILAGTFTYLLIRLYTGSRTGALMGAIIFTFAPSRINGGFYLYRVKDKELVKLDNHLALW